MIEILRPVALLLLLLLLIAPSSEAAPGRSRSPIAEKLRASRSRLNVPLASLRYWYTGAATLTDAAQPQALQLDFHTMQLNAMFGHRFARTGTVLVLALRYDVTFAAARSGAGPWHDDIYHAPFGRVAVMQSLAGRWGVTAYTMSGVASDMEEVAGRDVRLTIGGGATYVVSRDLRFVFGAMYTTAFFIPLPLPLLNIHYHAGPWRLSLLIPKGASIWHSWGQRLEFGLVFGVLNLRYGLHSATRYADELSALNVTAGPAVRIYLHQGFFLRADGGYNVRHFRIDREGERIYHQLTFAGFFASLSIGYML